MTTLPQSLQNSIHEIMDRCNGGGGSIIALLLSTTEGVPLGRVYERNSLTALNTTTMTNTNNNNNTASAATTNEDVISSIESIWSPASKQIPILGLNKLKQVTAMYEHGTIIQIYQAPMVRINKENVPSVFFF